MVASGSGNSRYECMQVSFFPMKMVVVISVRKFEMEPLRTTKHVTSQDRTAIFLKKWMDRKGPRMHLKSRNLRAKGDSVGK